MAEDEPDLCDRCHGVGLIWQQRQIDGHSRPERKTCPDCNGTGRK